MHQLIAPPANSFFSILIASFGFNKLDSLLYNEGTVAPGQRVQQSLPDLVPLVHLRADAGLVRADALDA
jgi:hypothetical protein